jgi:hypothetical protein
MPPIDFVAALIVWLRPQLAVDEKIGGQKPDTVPVGKFVAVHTSGGTRQWPSVDVPSVMFEAWGPTTASAHDLAQRIRALVWSRYGKRLGATGVQIYRIDEFSSPALLPDPESKEPRFVWTASIQHRENLETA